MIHVLKAIGGGVGFHHDTKENLEQLLKDWQEEDLSTSDDVLYSFEDYKSAFNFLLQQANKLGEF